MNKCVVPDCPDRPSNVDGFLCRRHWFKVPKTLRDQVWTLFRSKPGSLEHRRAVIAAIAAAQS